MVRSRSIIWSGHIARIESLVYFKLKFLYDLRNMPPTSPAGDLCGPEDVFYFYVVERTSKDLFAVKIEYRIVFVCFYR